MLFRREEEVDKVLTKKGDALKTHSQERPPIVTTNISIMKSFLEIQIQNF